VNAVAQKRGAQSTAAAVKRPRGTKRPRAQPAPKLALQIALDSSCWLEFFADTPRADLYADAIAQPEKLLVPLITVYEVAKQLSREAGDEVVAAALSLMQRGQVVGIDLPLALEAVVNGLPLADSLIYATTRHHGAELWTQDSHFDGLPGVRCFSKP
jgi:toxin FitB